MGDRFLKQVFSGGVFRSRAEAERAAASVLDAASNILTERDAASLAHELSPELGMRLLSGPHCGPRRLVDFLTDVASRQSVPLSLARDHAVVVLRALNRELSELGQWRLRRALPEDVTWLLGGRVRRNDQPTVPLPRPDQKHD